MRKLSALISVLVCCSVLGSCQYDLYGGKRPFNYGAAKWVCENPFVWFVIDPNVEDYYSPKGEIQVNNETLRFQLFFGHGTNEVSFKIIKHYGLGDKRLELSGECAFSPEKLIVTIDRETDTTFDGQYSILIFTRISTE